MAVAASDCTAAPPGLQEKRHRGGAAGPKPAFINMTAKWFSMGYTPKPNTYREEFKTDQQVHYLYDEKHEKILFTFDHEKQTYRIDFPLTAIADTIKVEHFGGREHPGRHVKEKTAIHTFILKCPGRLWRLVEDKGLARDRRWERAVALPPCVFVNEGSVLARDEPFPLRGYGQCVTYRIGLVTERSTNAVTAGSYFHLMKLLKWRKIVPDMNYSDHKMLFNYVELKNSVRLNHLDRFKRMEHSFELFFTLESFISYYRLHELVIPGEFYNLLCKIPPEAAVDALRVMCTRDECRIWQPLPCLKKIWNERFNLALGHRPRPQPHFAYIYKVLVTPTTIHFELPQLELSNRVIRRYWDHADRFLRVQFVEEGDTPLYLQDRNGPFGMGRVCQRIRDTLRHGIRIGDRYYEFLGFSASQLRNGGCWFFSSTKDLNVHDIRRWMGDFSQEKVVARYAARMGQCFSTTQPVFAVHSDQIKSLKDIVRNDHTFSDGIGRISQDLADQIAEVMGRKDKPTAFQFRLGGAKGVLAVHRRIKPNTIVLRPSQMKFSTKHKVLEINTAASYAIAMLNVDIVSVVNSLEVPSEAFVEILAEMVNSVNDMMTDGDKARAVLRASMDGLGNTRDLARIVEAGFFERGDPFIKNALTVFRAHRLKEARERTRIPVIKGGSVLGVLDETETLEENEVFLQYIDSDGKAQVVEGDVMVFRSPTLHPGDVRMCKAVYCPKLKHLRNVLAFSSKGERDIPSMCAGGDLDGDWFTVIWDERLFPPHFCRNQPPMDYPKMRGKELSKVTIEDVQAFFVEYMLNDQIKQISTAHRAIADGSPRGVSDKNCLELARAHSIAVDYAKTGCPANVDLELLRVNSYPDFMQKRGKPSWKSQKAIGLIYHKIDPKDYLNYREDLSDPVIDKYYDPRIQAPNMERYIGAARLLKQYYDRQVREKMTMNGITTEAELISGFVIDWLHKDKSKKTYEALNDIRKEMVRFRNDWRLAEFPDDMPREELEAKAAAWYYVAYHPLEQERQVQEAKTFDHWYQGGCGLISFPWISHEILCDLAEKNTTEEMESSKYPTFDEATIRQYKPNGIPSPHPYKSREEYDVRNDDGYAVSVVPEDGPRKWF